MSIVLITVVVLVFLHPFGAAFAIGIHPTPAGTPWTYQLLSGFVASLAVVSTGLHVWAVWVLHLCHEDGCRRWGRHRVNGTPWCDRHHSNARHCRPVEEILEDILAEIRRPGSS